MWSYEKEKKPIRWIKEIDTVITAFYVNDLASTLSGISEGISIQVYRSVEFSDKLNSISC